MRGAVRGVRTKRKRNQTAIMGLRDVALCFLTLGNIFSQLSLSLNNLPNEISLTHFIFFLASVSPFVFLGVFLLFFFSEALVDRQDPAPKSTFPGTGQGPGLSTQTIQVPLVESQRRGVFRKHLHPRLMSAGEAAVPSSPAQWRLPDRMLASIHYVWGPRDAQPG